jgi:hypothetical protein
MLLHLCPCSSNPVFATQIHHALSKIIIPRLRTALPPFLPALAASACPLFQHALSITLIKKPLTRFRRQGFGRQTNKSNNNNQAKGNGQNSPSPTGLGNPLAQSLPEGQRSPAFSSAMSLEGPSPSASQTSLPRRPAYFFREEYAGLIVKGNFMTLAAKPGLVDEGEWLAHQGT